MPPATAGHSKKRNIAAEISRTNYLGASARKKRAISKWTSLKIFSPTNGTGESTEARAWCMPLSLDWQDADSRYQSNGGQSQLKAL